MRVQLINTDLNYAYVITESNDRLKVALYKDEVGTYFLNEMLTKTYVIHNAELAIEDGTYFEGFEPSFSPIKMPNCNQHIMTYSEFLFSQLFMEYVTHQETIYDEYEYDLIYGEVVNHFQAFMSSTYNVNTMGEYDCIVNYLTNELH